MVQNARANNRIETVITKREALRIHDLELDLTSMGFRLLSRHFNSRIRYVYRCYGGACLRQLVQQPPSPTTIFKNLLLSTERQYLLPISFANRATNQVILGPPKIT